MYPPHIFNSLSNFILEDDSFDVIDMLCKVGTNADTFFTNMAPTDRPTDGRTDGRTGGRTDGRTDGQTHPLIEILGRI